MAKQPTTASQSLDAPTVQTDLYSAIEGAQRHESLVLANYYPLPFELVEIFA